MQQKQKKIPFSKQAYEKLKHKQIQLEQKRQEVIKRVQTAREMGDLSENAAYKYGKLEISSINRELREIAFLLRYGEIKKPKHGEIIDFGSIVTIESKMGKNTFTLVSEYESNPSENKLSINSPLGKLLINKKVGNTITVNAPAGDIEYKIIKVK